ncbi:hypothetical protein ABT255_56130, partial [Streptomyces mirabilis]
MENGTLRGWMKPVEPFLGPLHDVAKAFTGLTGVPVDLPAALFLRARLTGLPLPGRVSAGGSCHLLETADGWAAVNLARPDDLAAARLRHVVDDRAGLLEGVGAEDLRPVVGRLG